MLLKPTIITRTRSEVVVFIIEQLGDRSITPLVQKLRSKASPDTLGHAFQYGLAWGFLPCGLVYSALL
ncbi:MAG: hypothetical protein CMQ84_02425 [Gammaproteobacteria bacterium]|nr:hypothetical protein [Gammaproteobacteria bacterium]OUX79382.1 MAG: hypothetical protein CBC19_02830 [Oceanospirillales bacterium TMED59]